ncbi:MAG TPA: phosphatidate cytidylyltransferase [Bacteroidetes bacterium]|nr:phosphatidate cytidylyltransferase [Bacteroidota bacterium]
MDRLPVLRHGHTTDLEYDQSPSKRDQMTIAGHSIPEEILWILAVIFGVLLSCSAIIYLLRQRRDTSLLKEIHLRVWSWWRIAIGVAVVIAGPPWMGALLIAYISFVAMREMFSIGQLRGADRAGIFAAYLAIPVQYFLAWHFYFEQFLYFIPMAMFIVIPVLLVLNGRMNQIGRSMSIIPAILMLTAYMPSHMVLLYRLPVQPHPAGAGGLLIFLIMLTAFNDVFQFTWGKLLGKHKILPYVSPNKTWEGFVGGILTTSCLGMILSFLTPLLWWQACITGFVVGLTGFLGDSIISAIKRDLRLKDTDDLIPGHGGAMDRLDSILITAPFYFYLIKYFAGI